MAISCIMPRMIRPLRAGEAFLADVRAASGPLDLWWLGQSGFLVAYGGRHLLLDPYLSDSLTRKYADTDKPHVRMTERVIDPARLGFVDVVTASHAHTDHLDPDTLRALPDAVLVAPEAHRELAAERAGAHADRHRRRPDRRGRRVRDHRRARPPTRRSSATRRAGCSTSATSSAAARSRSTTPATRSPTTAWRSASAAGSTSRCCRSTAARPSAAWPAT